MTIWDWLEEVTYKKSPADSFSEKDWETFNSYMVHRFVSMNPYYIELTNKVQTILPTEKVRIYTVYRELIPKRKVFLKYIKGKNDKYNANLLDILSSHFECSKKESKEYFNVLGKPQIKDILSRMGFEKKEITKLLKV